MRWLRGLLSIGFAAALGCAVLAQPVDSALEEQVEVKLRLIEVAATDKKGRPLIDLQSDDFFVTVDGQPREIRSFDRAMRSVAGAPARPAPTEPGVASAGTVPAAGVEAPEPDAPGRWVVICLDADRIPNVYRNVVLKTARALVTEGGRPQDRFAVALLRNGELSYVHDFAPPSELDIRVLEDAGMLVSRPDDLRFRLDEMVGLIEPCKDYSDWSACVLNRSDEFLSTLRNETDRGMRSMRGLVASMAPLPGRKALVWFSNGFVLQPGEIVIEALTRYVGDPRLIESRLRDRGNFSYDSLLVEASRARVSFFSLRAGHDISYAMRGADRADVPREIAGTAGNPYRLSNTLSEESLRDAAESTGGRAVFTPLVPALATDLLDRLDAVYTLGIGVEPQDRYSSRVKVKLQGRKGKVHSRRRLPRGVKFPAKLVAMLTPVPPAPDALPGEQRVLLAVELKNMGVEEDREFGRRSRVALYSRLTDLDGREIESSYRILEVPRKDETEQHFVRPFNYQLDAGEYYAEVSISDLVNKGTTSVTTKITAGE